jgi:membrane associated rhomboid family serine protease
MTLCISPVQYVGLILGSAVASSMAYLWQAQHMQRTSYQRRMALGLSGVAMGVGAAAACAVPKCQVQLRGFGFFSMPLPFFMAGYALYDSYMLDNLASETAHIGHLGGLVFGAVYYFFVLRDALPLSRFAR